MRGIGREGGRGEEGGGGDEGEGGAAQEQWESGHQGCWSESLSCSSPGWTTSRWLWLSAEADLLIMQVALATSADKAFVGSTASSTPADSGDGLLHMSKEFHDFTFPLE